MIDTNDVIKELLEYYLEEQYIVDYQKTQEASQKAVSGVTDGVVFNKLRSNHSKTIETLKLGVTDDALRSEIAQVYRRKIRSNAACAKSNDTIDHKKQLLAERALQDILSLPIHEWLKEYTPFYNSCIRDNIDKNCLSDSEFKVLLYLYYAFDNHLYLDKYNDEVLGLQKEFMGLQTQYGKDQFVRYNLVEVDNTRSLLAVNPPRLYDKFLNRTFLLKNIPLSLCKILTDTEGINMLSVRLLDSVGVEGKLTKDRKDEELERGHYFDFSVLGHFSITRLYSAILYQDALWVVIDDNNITFEELYDSPDSIHNNAIVTQVLHCQYTKYNDEYYITHLDHEYIFYTGDEYSVRKLNPKQKGHEMPRMKNFKIDDSKIKLTPQFLYNVLVCYFRHTERLQEYFQKCIEPSVLHD